MKARTCRLCAQPGHYAKTCGRPPLPPTYRPGPCSKRCGQDRDTDRSAYCKACRSIASRTAQHRQYHDRVDRGVCTDCGKKRAMRAARVCWDCLQRQRAKRRAYVGSKPRQPHGPGRPLLTFEDV